jgi:hypothetical protein
MARRIPDFRGADYTYRDRHLSMWQSAARAVSQKTSKYYLASFKDASPENLEERLMAPVDRVHARVTEARQRSGFLLPVPGALSTTKDCAELAAEFLAAEIRHDKKLAAEIADRLKKSVCDLPGWAQCVEQYLKFKKEGGDFPYREHQDVLRQMPDDVSIAIVGDWGTGEGPAVHLLQEVANLKPNILLHLGDVYYSGTEDEMQHNFLQICRGTLPDATLFSLCGNHDMYSGGNAYYALVDEIGQGASYFLLANQNWQILAMDTGNNDRSPLTVASSMTSLHDSEAQWHRDKIKAAGKRRTILMSHHQLFSPFTAVGKIEHRGYSYNPYLFETFRGQLGTVEWWFWGHEHNLAVYEPHMGLKRGRCVGASAIPVLNHQQSYTADTSLQTYQNKGLPRWIKKAELQKDKSEYNHAFAMLNLKGTSASADYYEVPFGGSAKRIYSE